MARIAASNSTLNTPIAAPSAMVEESSELRVTKSMRNALLPLIEELRKICEKEGSHGNRTVEAANLLLALFLAFFNTGMTTLRNMETASEHPDGLEWIGVKTPRTTLSDSLACLNPDLLLPILDDLIQRMPADWAGKNADFADLAKQIIAVDGSFFNLAADVSWALSQKPGGKKNTKAARLNVMLDCERGIPMGVSVRGKGESESAAMIKKLVACVVYVCDRGFYSHALISAILKIDSDFVIRVKSNTQLEEVKVLPVSKEDAEEWGVISDRLVTPSQWRGEGKAPILRETVLDVSNREGGRTRIRLLTSLKDVAARIVAMVYQRRWQVELFFRWLKVNVHYRHLFSHSPRGVQWQFYAGILATLAMCQQTGRKPGKHTLTAIKLSIAWGTDLSFSLSIAKRHEDQIARDGLLRKERIAKRKKEAQESAAKSTGSGVAKQN